MIALVRAAYADSPRLRLEFFKPPLDRHRQRRG